MSETVVLSDERKARLAGMSAWLRQWTIDYNQYFMRECAPIGCWTAEYVAGVQAELDFLISLEVAAELDSLIALEVQAELDFLISQEVQAEER